MATLIVADVHANAHAFDAVLEAAPDFDRVLFLGDAVDVGPTPDRALALIRSTVDERVIGNHDRSVLSVDLGAEPDDEYVQWRQWTKRQITGSNLEYLEEAPRTTVATVDDRDFRIHHGDFEPPDDATEWSTRATPEEMPAMFETVADRYEEQYILLGHSHRPFVTEIGDTTFVNPGSVGLQRGDMQSDVARYALFDGDGFELRTTEYDVEPVLAACDDLPLPEEFVTTWKRNYRPNEDD